MLCFLFVQITTKCNIVQIVQVLDLALAKITESDKKTIIWNFMEELWENYLNALENNLPTKFNFMDFFNFGILKDGFSENDKISVIKQYAKEKGYIKITGTEVSVTKKGLEEFQKDTHDWDIHT
jgi:hypothetical protein